MSRQAEKYHLSLAGEFYVAAELQRRGISAAVTYSNAKKADVVAFSSGSYAVAIEVKSTPGPDWVVGGSVPQPSSLRGFSSASQRKPQKRQTSTCSPKFSYTRVSTQST